LLRDKQSRPQGTTKNSSDGKLPDGAFQAMDHAANSVRFADSKATILAAGLGVLTTVLMSNTASVISAIRSGSCGSVAVSFLGIAAVLSFFWTLGWLVNAIVPRRTVTGGSMNRFAWPTLTSATGADLMEHADLSDVREEAWRQVADLSRIADRKFRATHKAVFGFGGLVASAVLVVGTSLWINAA